MPISNLIELAITLALEIWLLVVLFRRKVPRHFPLFFTYSAYTVAIAIARLITIGNYRVYFYVFWWTDALLLLLGLAALHETFRWVYRGFYEFWWFRLIYYGTISVVLLVTVRNAIVNPPASDHPNGFLALAQYDSNGDGVIDAKDPIYSQLRLWVDANHDGISQPGELHTLPEMGVLSINLDYSLSQRTDEFGNIFRYKAKVNAGQAGASDVGKKAYDVFFVNQ